MFTRIIKAIAEKTSRKLKHDKVAITRAKHILAMRERKIGVAGGLSPPTKGIGFFPFEEDIMHHIGEALVVCSTGISQSFFADPYVRQWLQRMNPRHRPIYRLKLVRLIRCAMDVTHNEVSEVATKYVIHSCSQLQL